MAEHTPGPWHWGANEHALMNEDESVWIWTELGVGNSADGRLIAAAPDLLAALQGILYAPMFHPEDEWDGLFAQGRTAIAKAIGSETIAP